MTACWARLGWRPPLSTTRRDASAEIERRAPQPDVAAENRARIHHVVGKSRQLLDLRRQMNWCRERVDDSDVTCCVSTAAELEIAESGPRNS